MSNRKNADKELRRRLNGILHERDIKMQELVEMTGLARWTIHMMRTGSNPSLYTLRAVKAALGCTWDELLGP